MNQPPSCPSSVVSGVISSLDPEADKQRLISALVSQATSLHTEIEERESALEKVKERLLELGPGKYYSLAGGRVTVVGPSTAMKPGPDQIAAARTLAGTMAGRLFTRQVVYRPVNGLRDIARALLSPRRAEKIIALCEVATAPQVRF